MFKIDLNKWPNFLELINSYLNPWDTNPKAWENYDYDAGIFVLKGTRSKLQNVFYPVIIQVQLVVARELCKDPERENRKEFIIIYDETESLARFLETVEPWKDEGTGQV